MRLPECFREKCTCIYANCVKLFTSILIPFAQRATPASIIYTEYIWFLICFSSTDTKGKIQKRRLEDKQTDKETEFEKKKRKHIILYT